MNILIAEDHPLTKKALLMILAENFPDATLNETGSQKDLLTLIKKKNIDLVILDMELSDGQTTHLIPVLKEISPSTKILIFTNASAILNAQYAMNTGADGFLNKTAEELIFVKAIKRVLEGKKYLDEDLMYKFLFRDNSDSPFSSLSVREQEVVQLLISGCTIKEIGSELGLASSTVCTHRDCAFKKLNIKNIVELIHLTYVWHSKS